MTSQLYCLSFRVDPQKKLEKLFFIPLALKLAQNWIFRCTEDNEFLSLWAQIISHIHNMLKSLASCNFQKRQSIPFQIGFWFQSHLLFTHLSKHNFFCASHKPKLKTFFCSWGTASLHCPDNCYSHFCWSFIFTPQSSLLSRW